MSKALELIGDVGGSSSRWALLFDDGRVDRIGTSRKRLIGFNPAVGASTAFEKQVGNALARAIGPSKPKAVTVYGAGCGSVERAARMKNVVARMLGMRAVQVETDLMGAARGTLGARSGLVLILGTGMNAGWYHRGRLHTPMPSLGWVVGDEGSGTDIGKHLLHDAMHGLLPTAVMRGLFGKNAIHGDDLRAILGADRPNAELAGLAWRLGECSDGTFRDALLAERFGALVHLMERYFGERKAHAVHAVGGIAHRFSTQLAEALEVRGFRAAGTVADPMDGLIAWHQQGLVQQKQPAARRLR